MTVGMMVGMAATGLPELDVARIVKYCASRVPKQYRHEIRVECDIAPRHVTICECRPPWREDFGPGVDAIPDRPPVLHEENRVVDVVLAGSAPQISPLPVLGSEPSYSGFTRSHRKRWRSDLLGLIRYRR